MRYSAENRVCVFINKKLTMHLSLPRSFIPDLKIISFTNPFLHSQSYSSQTASADLQTCTELKGHWRLFVLVSGYVC